ncbi:MAG: hypothetical protein IT576_06135, partial [Verrucomicrobiales bacterium]|nr:hypothetical protein [Verrucomicrobiales bacterium]
GSLALGPGLIVAATLGLWYNEGRFDYFEAGQKADIIHSPVEAPPREPICLSGRLKECVVNGKYVARFEGYYAVSEIAEIFSWKRSSSRKKGTKWYLGWHSSLQSNERNTGLKRQLSGGTLRPKFYQIDGLLVRPEKLHFVNDSIAIETGSLPLSEKAKPLGLSYHEGAWYLRNHPGSEAKLGDERIRYQGIPATESATYFGAIERSEAVGKQFEIEQSYVSKWIHNDGFLHYLVNGSREEALHSLKSHLTRITWIVRSIGSILLIVGFLIFFSSFLQFLIAIPFLGNLVEAGVLIVSLLIGGSLAVLTIVSSMAYHHPNTVMPALVIGGAVISFVFIKSRSSKKNALNRLRNHQEPNGTSESTLSDDSWIAGPVKAAFGNLVKLAMADGTFDEKENDYLVAWAKERGLSDETLEALFQEIQKTPASALQATTMQDLYSLVSLALIDGRLSSKELRHIINFGKLLGLNRLQVNEVIAGVRSGIA